MTTNQVMRESMPDGQLKLSAGDCTFLFRRLRPAVLLVTISGDDRGEFGNSTLDEIRMEIMRNKPLELFVDARAAIGAALTVSQDWTKFFSTNRENLKRVSILVGSKVVTHRGDRSAPLAHGQPHSDLLRRRDVRRPRGRALRPQ